MKSLTVLLALLACVLCAGVVLAVPAPDFHFNPGPDPSQRHFGYDVAGGKSHGSPAHLSGTANADAWVSKDGNTRVNVGADFRGPASNPKVNEGRVNLEHRW